MLGDALLTSRQVHPAPIDERAALPELKGLEANVFVTFSTIVTEYLIDEIERRKDWFGLEI